MDKTDIILSKIECIVDKINDMDNRLDGIDNRLDGIDNRLDGIDNRLDGIDSDIKDMKLTLENEVRTNIMRVAEGHLDLVRNFKEATRTNNEYEMLAIRVNMLETDVRELKSKIS